MSIPESASNLIYLLLEKEDVIDKRVYPSMAKKGSSIFDVDMKNMLTILHSKKTKVYHQGWEFRPLTPMHLPNPGTMVFDLTSFHQEKWQN